MTQHYNTTPIFFLQEIWSNMIQDYRVETKSGKGQTHMATSIAIQRQETQPNIT